MGATPTRAKHSCAPIDFLGPSGVFETLRSHQGRILAMDEHMNRLAASARTLGLELRREKKAIGRWVHACLKKSRIRHASLRLAVLWEEGRGHRLFLTIRRFTGYPPEFFTRGVRVQTAATRRSPARSFPHAAKSNQYLNGILALQDGLGASSKYPLHLETLILDARGYLSEGTVSNIFVVRRGQIWTPPVSCGILMGTLRRWVLQTARKMGVRCHEMPLTRHDVYNADEVFLTNTSMEIMPVTRCDHRRIRKGRPGPLGAKLRQAFRLALNSEFLIPSKQHESR